MEGRACHAIELNPAYVDVAIQRWQAFTGKEATLDGDGRFVDIAASRGVTVESSDGAQRAATEAAKAA